MTLKQVSFGGQKRVVERIKENLLVKFIGPKKVERLTSGLNLMGFVISGTTLLGFGFTENSLQNDWTTKIAQD